MEQKLAHVGMRTLLPQHRYVRLLFFSACFSHQIPCRVQLAPVIGACNTTRVCRFCASASNTALLRSHSAHAKSPRNYVPDLLPTRITNHLLEALDRSELSLHRLISPGHDPRPSPTIRLSASRHAELWYLYEYPRHVHQSHAIQDKSHERHGRYDSPYTKLSTPAIVSTG